MLSSQAKKRTEALSIDLGQQSTKVVHLGRKGDKIEMRGFGIHPSPFQENAMTVETLCEHIKMVTQPIDSKPKKLTLVLGVNDSLLRQAEMPMVPVGDIRLMLKYNSKSYLQQDLADYAFDCHVQAPYVNGSASPEAAKPLQKVKVLVGGARQQLLDMLQAAGKQAGFTVQEIIPAMICPANAFEQAFETEFRKEAVALVDIGFRSSSISFLLNGEMALSRVVAYGGDKLTSGLAEIQNISYLEAESLKLSLAEEIQTLLQALLMPLGRELRASIDFFEHQQDRSVSQVYISGGSARSQFIVETLQSELMVPSKTWSSLNNIHLSVPPQQYAEMAQIAPQLTVSIGGALAAL
ncbi:MAG: pilus assembly protein PilM [Verrucomicrobiales bacterium]